jgi:thymidylate synthase (FAD)
MKIIEAKTEILQPLQAAVDMLKLIEQAGRTCYKSEGQITEDSAPDFVRRITQVKKHESVIEHSSITVMFTVDRGVSHELVRHRLAAFSQESTRYCNYAGDKFGREITVIKPMFLLEGTAKWDYWLNACQSAEAAYFDLIVLGCSPQEARSVLPNSLKTELVMTCNLREWRHVFSLRCAGNAHPQMRQVMVPLLAEFKGLLPAVFDDLP